ncbi:FGGY family carbohydrate kinase [Mesorhizobium sp. CAU 1732]|uniref:FGGY family carbohydrate kinase n=1 Tax=Mesorhizobium sp. CAU 1732 TaxID=3140358 RepID=UPI003260D777
MTSVLVCLDSGTTTVKAAAFDMAGRMVSSAQRDNSALRRQSAVVEQDMAVTRADAFAVLKACIAKIEGEVAGIVVTGQGDGLWPLGADMQPVGHAITWLDGRCRALTARLQADGEACRVIEAVTGARPTAASQSLHCVWLAENEPDRLAQIAHILRAKEWLFFCLTGELKAEPSAVLPVWGDWRGGQASPAIQEALGLARGIELLPELASIAECRAGLSPDIAGDLGLAAGTPVLLGPGDVQATLIGLGLGSTPDVTRASIFGTSAIHACHLSDPAQMQEKPAGAMIQHYALGEGYLCFHPSFNGATLLKHLAAKLAEQPAAAAPSYSSLILHPFFEPGGERAPYTTPYASGALFGVTADTSPAEIAWAGREALAFVARKSHEMMNAPEGTLALGGGLAADPHFAGFLATATGQKVACNTGGDSGLRGLAMIGARFIHGLSQEAVAKDWRGAPDAWAEPQCATRDYAESKYRLFVRLIDAIEPFWEAIADLGDKSRLPMKDPPR